MVTAKSTPKVTEETPPAEDATTDAVKVQVRSTPTVSDPVSEVSTKADLTVHHELTITPTGDVSDKPAEDIVPVVKPEPVKVEAPAPAAAVAPVESTVAKAMEDKATQPAAEAEAFSAVGPEPPVDDAPKTDPQPSSSQVPPKPGEMQSPKVFDTKQYHLPIDEGAAGGKGKHIMMFVVILLLLAVAGVVAIDAGWIKPGFDLPFDLIK